MDVVIEARGVSRTFGDLKAVEDCRFELRRGQCLAISGNSGSGKTTLLRMLAGMIPPSRGELFVLDLNARDSAPIIRDRVGMVPERDGFDMQLTLLDTLMVHGRLYGRPRSRLKARARELLRWLQLDEAEDWPVFELKRQQMRRLSLARALVSDPEVLLVDGAGRDLPAEDRKEIWRLLGELKEKGMTIVVGSRELDDLEEFSDQVIILDRGRIACKGVPATLIRDHIGRDVVEYDILSSDLEYHLQAMAGKFSYQLLSHRLKIFIPETVDAVTALRWVPSERVVYRRARLGDVFSKVTGQELSGGGLG